MLLSTVTSWLAPFLAAPLHNYLSPPAPAPTRASRPLRFELRHLHAISPDARVVFRDVRQADVRALGVADEYALRPRKVKTHRPRSAAAFERARARSARLRESEAVEWDEDEVEGPDVADRETMLLLAKMTNNAYLAPDEQGWYDLGSEWNVSYPFGWEPGDDGFRGHVFATPDNSTIVLSIKGTSAAVIGGGGPTSKKDKLNDNLLFSCCCARVDWTWTTVCGCYRGGWKCDQTCLEGALIEDSLFYPIGTNLYNNLTYLYPDSTIWMTGHSLGGALASLLGVTFGAPTVSFESPGEKMAASRLHLPSPPSTQHITHLYHTADPIAMGTCNGVLSSCALGGYAMESKCHLGKSIIYDTVSNLSWAVDVRTHTIVNVIEKLLAGPWPPAVDKGREVPEALPEDDCVECYSWDYGDYVQ
ncbi:alpha/beta-hydrolase [Epithele typhae]|uniref:alpha/beta-hydrolase n=1 Tax=Epithele typhae TaxID=378194 RepID=UPI0020087A1B|nr:alpha/beta-hydrolase [Epithele typhae]KAH9945068.1 alpha/beta-hydrolase [Epithele typhae]